MIKNKRFLDRLNIALYGLKAAFKEEDNFRVQIMIAFLVIILMVVLKLNPIEDSILLLTIFVVLSLELINSQIEKFLDIIQPEHHPRVKVIKDFSAGAVLIVSTGSVVIGFLVFYPYLVNLFMVIYK